MTIFESYFWEIACFESSHPIKTRDKCFCEIRLFKKRV